MFKCHFACGLSLLSYHRPSELCAVLVPAAQRTQSLFHVGAVGQEFPLNCGIIHYFWNLCWWGGYVGIVGNNATLVIDPSANFTSEIR